MQISETTKSDFRAFWPVFKDIVEAQETYAIDPAIDVEAAYQLWCISPHKSFVIKEDNNVLGTYYLKANASGPSAHIANCGYMVSPASRGKGLATTLCLHSQRTALALGYTAMQFNSVVSTNQVAVNLWKKLGYSIIGTIPNVYHHKQHGLVDAFIMHKALSPIDDTNS